MTVLKGAVQPSEVDLSSFKPQKEMEPSLWTNGKLHTDVRLSLLETAYEFVISAKVTSFCDIILTGSLANYNWSRKYSDIDLHIVVDFSQLSPDPVIAKAYFDEKRSNWNSCHSGIKVHGYPVEVYVQDKSEPHKSTGVYSLMRGCWVESPSLDKLPYSADDLQVRQGVSAYCNMVDSLVQDFTARQDDLGEVQAILDVADKIYDEVKSERKESMSKSKRAELTTGNVLFKSMRRSGHIGKLLQLRRACFDKLHSLE